MISVLAGTFILAAMALDDEEEFEDIDLSIDAVFGTAMSLFKNGRYIDICTILGAKKTADFITHLIDTKIEEFKQTFDLSKVHSNEEYRLLFR